MTTLRMTLCALVLAGALSSQSFIQMSDPHFGMFRKDEGFQHETVNFDFAIASANRLKPVFVVITGDLVNDRKSAAEVAEYRRIAAKLADGDQGVGRGESQVRRGLSLVARHRETSSDCIG